MLTDLMLHMVQVIPHTTENHRDFAASWLDLSD